MLHRDRPFIIFTRMTTSGNTTVTLGLVQMRCSTDPEENLEKAITGVREAAAKGAQIVCLQELFRSQYFCQTEDHRFFDLAEPIPGPSTERLSKLAGELGVVIVASLFEKRAAGLYHNTAAVLDADGKYLGKYRKMHIPDDPAYYEKFYFTPGDLGFRAWDTRFGRIGVLICWDQWYPEAARLTALERRPDSLLPDRHRLASGGEAGVRSAAAVGLGDDPAQPRHRQRGVCLRREPRGARGRPGRRDRVLGRKLRLRPRWPRAGARAGPEKRS